MECELPIFFRKKKLKERERKEGEKGKSKIRLKPFFDFQVTMGRYIFGLLK
jgi:hypothetical protein